VVVGGGIAGLMAALAAARRARVLVLSKGSLDSGCTPRAQGGIAAAVGPDDSPELHFEDTVAAGRGLCDPAAVRVLVEEGPLRIGELVEWGVPFDRSGGALDLHREAAHRRPRVLHAGGDATGAAVEAVLLRRLHASGAAVLEDHAVTRIAAGASGCAGVEVRDQVTGEVVEIRAGAVVLASGGAAALWRHTTNPPGQSGDGLVLAALAGADLADLEFVQFHPTVLAHEDVPSFLISEAVRGEGAIVTGAEGRRFLFDSDPRGELAPRDVVARAIAAEMERSGSAHALLDVRPLGARFAERFPTIAAVCRAAGIDASATPIPIAPASHYTIGGVVTDLVGATTVPGLFACGEVARTGVHGANRLASNSLLEGLVFGQRAGRAAAAHAEARGSGGPPPRAARTAASRTAGPPSLREIAAFEELRSLMWSACGITRDGRRLEAGLAAIAELEAASLGEGGTASRLGLAFAAAGFVVAAALAREESRGAHHRSDFPSSRQEWARSRVIPGGRRPLPPLALRTAATAELASESPVRRRP
jgi:L-aspartate oxidase